MSATNVFARHDIKLLAILASEERSRANHRHHAKTRFYEVEAVNNEGAVDELTTLDARCCQKNDKQQQRSRPRRNTKLPPGSLRFVVVSEINKTSFASKSVAATRKTN